MLIHDRSMFRCGIGFATESRATFYELLPNSTHDTKMRVGAIMQPQRRSGDERGPVMHLKGHDAPGRLRECNVRDGPI